MIKISLLIAVALLCLAAFVIIKLWKELKFVHEEVIRYRNGYTLTHEALEDVKEKLKTGYAVKIPADKVITIIQFGKQELAYMSYIFDKFIKAGCLRGRQESVEIEKIWRKIDEAVIKLSGQDEISATEIKELVSAGEWALYISEQKHKRRVVI